jgi:uncharacterized protein (DUF58 family)
MVVASHSMAQQAGQGQMPPSAAASEQTAFEPRQFFYPVPWRAHSYHAGATLTKHHGNGTDFAGYASLLACPDPKRIDIRASVRTQPQQWLVRTYLERAAIHAYAILDISSSLFFSRTLCTRLAAATDRVYCLALVVSDTSGGWLRYARCQ